MKSIVMTNQVAQEGMMPIHKERLSRILHTLDNYLGDTDPDIPEDWTDDDIRQEEPLIWIHQQLVELFVEILPQCVSESRLHGGVSDGNV